ncbi:MAG: Gldg family protein [Aulosira sp. ZfuVER01]|nr:Gldg family protein [Aulosira sp. ZfuVER01]MDZ7998962.1 Gldg family protein [Aulosira sp. DedVER01a]MDZ8053702.1 Gldg family protein [Aulosira sp. ZfuCHP01]
MNIVPKKKLWKYLFWLGPFLLVAGLTSGLVASNWGPISLALLITGIAIVGLWMIVQSQESQWWKQRSTQAGTNALVATIAVLAILGLINFLGTRYHYRADLTETQLFTLAPQSRELVNNLGQPVKVWIFDVNQNPQDQDLLENYRRQSSKFQFEYVDPQARPGLAEKFGVKDYGEVYLESQDKRQLVQVVNQNERLSEIRLTNRLQQIATANSAKVYFLQGHGEHQLNAAEGGISQAVQGLTDKNFTTSPLNLVEQSKVPDDAAVVVVAGPKRELFEGEVKALSEYLNRGGNLLLMIDPGSDPKLDNLLKDWGVRLDNRLAVDVSGSAAKFGPAVPIITEYGQHPITKDFGNGSSYYRFARPVETTPVAGVESTPLLRTKPYPNSWAESDLQSEKLEFNADKDMKGPLTLGVALKKQLPAPSATQPSPTPSPLPSPTTQGKATPSASPIARGQAKPNTTASPTPSALPLPTTASQASPTPNPLPSPTLSAPPTEKPAGKTATESRLVVIGNSDFATNGFFDRQLNGDVFLNSVTWLSQQDQQPLSIRPKEAKNRRLDISAPKAGLLTLLSLLLLPLIGLLGASLIWWKRR